MSTISIRNSIMKDQRFQSISLFNSTLHSSGIWNWMWVSGRFCIFVYVLEIDSKITNTRIELNYIDESCKYCIEKAIEMICHGLWPINIFLFSFILFLIIVILLSKFCLLFRGVKCCKFRALLAKLRVDWIFGVAIIWDGTSMPMIS